MSKMNVLIAGATGYLGNELIKILVNHRRIRIKYLCGSSSVGKKITDFDKSIKFKLPKISKINKSKINECDVIFSALPNGEAQTISNKLNKNNVLIDLSGDFNHYTWWKTAANGATSNGTYPTFGVIISPLTDITSGKSPAANAAVVRVPRSLSSTGITSTVCPVNLEKSSAICCCFASRGG